jgi:hypothetical protein
MAPYAVMDSGDLVAASLQRRIDLGCAGDRDAHVLHFGHRELKCAQRDITGEANELRVSSVQASARLIRLLRGSAARADRVDEHQQFAQQQAVVGADLY